MYKMCKPFPCWIYCHITGDHSDVLKSKQTNKKTCRHCDVYKRYVSENTAIFLLKQKVRTSS